MSVYTDDTKLFNEYTSSKTKCKCGHSILIPNRKEKAICNWCGEYVFRSKQAEFKHRFKENLLKEKKNEHKNNVR